MIITLRHSSQAFVERLDVITPVGFGDGGQHRDSLGLRGQGPTEVITDLGVLRPDPVTKELVLTDLHPGVTVDQVEAATGWNLRIADEVTETAPPTATEIAALADLRAQT